MRGGAILRWGDYGRRVGGGLSGGGAILRWAATVAGWAAVLRRGMDGFEAEEPDRKKIYKKI